MTRLVLRRLTIAVPLVFIVSVLTFVLESLAPGDTARTILGTNYTPEGYAQLHEKLGLGDPVLVQYWHWLTDAVRGDLGVSPISGLSVGSEIVNRMGVTLSLIVGTTLVSALLGVALGVLSAVRGGRLGKAIDVFSLLGFALPNFWLGLVLITGLAVTVRLFPATGYVPLTASPSEWVASLVLPVITLALGGAAAVAKQTRDSMSDALDAEYVYVLRANGASERSLVLRHALRNAAIPVVTVVGLLFVGLLNSTVLVEGVFAMPGLGGLAVQATTQHDLPMIQGVAVTFTIVVVIVNLLVDLLYGWLNPKVRVR
ncbi:MULTISPECIES: ABC transporter permease [Amycolatopsis]|uniref:Peptide/nickel transport system permease protein n=1 Tax=Amycolatopsis thermoflava TaxID=84480 RepID=A0A3N2H398_9PSEU|nr:ABC transporter permease [Amycolatopsis thermoflava]ROS43361.1 peptide/nickel transport system permease protein [Amycolatopsis thermoflava]